MIVDRSFGKLKLVFLIIVLALLGLLGVLAFRAGPAPVVKITSNHSAIGKRTTIKASIAEPVRGLSQVKVELIQGDRTRLLSEKSYAYRPALSLSGTATPRDEITVDVGRDTLAELKPGDATVRVTANRVGSWLRHPDAVVEQISLPVRLSPPPLQITSTQVYVAQGGCEVVVYRVGGTCVKDGVRAGD